MIEIGVFCHEYGHTFGLPDLYDLDGSSNGVGGWCLMGSGSYGGGSSLPTHMSAWCKEQLGWVVPAVISSPQPDLAIPNIEQNPTVFKVYPRGEVGDEYYLIENRHRTGFDISLAMGGLAIWHIDNSVPGNSNENHKMVDLEEADGNNDLDLLVNSGDAGDVYPGSSFRRLFDDTTNPNSRGYDGVPTCFGVSGISDSGLSMTADVDPSGGCALYADDFVVEDPCGDQDGFADPGERIRLTLGLRIAADPGPGCPEFSRRPRRELR
jgi:immune inhibitor A